MLFFTHIIKFYVPRRTEMLGDSSATIKDLLSGTQVAAASSVFYNLTKKETNAVYHKNKGFDSFPKHR